MDNLQYNTTVEVQCMLWGFKPYYKWITFNTKLVGFSVLGFFVLNLIING